MTDRSDDTRLHVWLDQTIGESPDPDEGTRQVMSEVEEASQAGRWLPFPVRRRQASTETPTTDGTTSYQPSPVPASNGRNPTVKGRTRSMFSPVTAIAAGTFAFAVGGALLIAQPFDQRPASVPVAEAEAIAPTWVTGRVTYAPSCTEPESEQDGAVRRDRNIVCNPQKWTTSDPRLSGEVAASFSSDVYELEDRIVAVNVAGVRVHNEDGEWTCSSIDLGRGEWESSMTNLADPTVTCVGHGGYEGLSAVVVVDDDGRLEFEGLIFSGGVPPLPEPPAAD